MKLSVIIPVYNEVETIAEVLRRVRAVPVEKEVIVVDDGSRDGTREWLRGYRAPDTRVFFHDRNRGKGAAIRTGLRYVTGDVVLIQDADLELDPAEYPSLLEPIRRGETQVVFGSRFLRPPERVLWVPYWANRVLTWLTNRLYHARLTDMMTCYKVFTREVARCLHLVSDRFEVEPELTAKILRGGWSIREVPVTYRPRPYRQGKKIGVRDFFRVVRTLWRFRHWEPSCEAASGEPEIPPVSTP